MKELYRIKLFFRDSMKIIDNTKTGIQSIINTISKEYFLSEGNHIINTKHVTDFRLFKLKFMEEPVPNEPRITSNEIEIPLTREEVEEIFKAKDNFNWSRGEE